MSITLSRPTSPIIRRQLRRNSSLLDPGGGRFVRQLMEIDTDDDLDLEGGDEDLESKITCEGRLADHSAQIYYCTKCRYNFCDNCWEEELAHRHDDCDHERSRLADFQTVSDALHPKKGNEVTSEDKQSDKSSEQDIRKGDASNMWFGVSEPQGGNRDYFLYEGIAYERLMLAGPSNRPTTTSPSLVSFIGETGSGKSALIKLLIKFSSDLKRRCLPTPVVSLPRSGRSTSSNVHLYADPLTLRKPTTILYADCEGTGGSENPTNAEAEESGIHWPRSFQPTQIQWGEKREGKESLKSRYFIAQNLYPRVLYIFSDVIVYVLFNDKRKDDMVLELIRWADNATKQSYNKPVLPHLIIALNKEQGSPNQDFYSIDTATEAFLDHDDIKNVHNNPRIREDYTKQWQTAEGGSAIDSGKALLGCYFSDVAVIHLPDQHCPTKMHDQITALYNLLTDFSTKCQKRRADMQMKFSAAAFPLYSRKAFKQFASSFTKPFDFSEAWFDLSPVTFNFKDSILSIAHLVSKDLRLNGMKLWEALTDFIASCFLLSWSRNRIQGAPEGVVHEHLEQLKAASREYWDHFWPCEKTLEVKGQRMQCVNSKTGHEFHQFGVGGPKIPEKQITTGDTLENLHDYLEKKVVKRIKNLRAKANEDEVRVKQYGFSHCIWQAHLQNVQTFYGHMESLETFSSHSVCFSCLDTAPDYHLPCGHVICTACVVSVTAVDGDIDKASISGGFVRLKDCPLGRHGELWVEPWVGMIKPDQAGVRIMSLDGGGIRGIVELELLKMIQADLCDVQIRDCFDLIVGTSAGGIISLGLGPQKMTVEQCSKMFGEFAEAAFTPNVLESVPWIGRKLGYLGQILHHSKYQSGPLEKALQKAFPTDLPLFGGTYQSGKCYTKVAVTSTTQEGRVLLLSNYNRKPPGVALREALYRFHRPGPDNNLKIWEVARATSAAPTYYTPFAHIASDQVLLDGGLYNNNPIKVADAESKAIWPENRNQQPDIILSLGTGFETCEMSLDSAPIIAEQIPISEHRDPPKPEGLSTKGYAKLLLEMQYEHVMNSMHSERAWYEWLGIRAPSNQDQRRYRRLNVELTKKIELDDVGKLGDCRDMVGEWAKNNDNKNAITNTANHILSSCFYYSFPKGHIYETWDEGYRCHGTMECRLPRGKDSSTSRLGQYWEGLYKSSEFLPSFIIAETHQGSRREMKQIPIATIENMAQNGEFRFDLNVWVSSKRAETEIGLMIRPEQTKDGIFPISGFPRRLQDDYEDLDREKPPGVVRRVKRLLLDYIPLTSNPFSWRLLGWSSQPPSSP